jgi:monofunctional biosynthetic peptidoglycan transglycosylase
MSVRAGEYAARAYRSVFPDTSILKTSYPVAVGKEGSRNLYKFQRSRPEGWVSLKEVPRHVIGAVIMAEDAEFFQHRGYSPDGIREALEHNSKPGVKNKRGGSTITQQVVKNLFLTPEKTMTRKVRELLLAMELERKFSKGKILETYLNIAEWGPGVYGIERASRRYFEKPAADLSAKEAAILAFMLPNPNRYQHSIRDGELTEFATKRVDAILERMWKTGKISDEEYVSSAVGIDLSL